MELVRGILVDIEGTTTPISFVYDVLFPYAREHLATKIATAASDPAIARGVEVLRAEWEAEPRGSGAALPPFGDGTPYALYLMDSDRKSTGLKALQGLIWQDGYSSGTLRSEVFEDVPGALERWHEAGVTLAVFSSGSVLAQKLLFAHTRYGDLSGRFNGWFDTTTGPKRESVSYRAIAAKLGLSTREMLSLSDVVEELDAAREAGMTTGLLARPGNPRTPACGHPVHETFRTIEP